MNISCSPNLNLTEKEWATFFAKCREEFETQIMLRNSWNPVYLAQQRTFDGYFGNLGMQFQGFLMARAAQLPNVEYGFERKAPEFVPGKKFIKVHAVSRVCWGDECFGLPKEVFGNAFIGYALTRGNLWPERYDPETGHMEYKQTTNHVAAEYVDIILASYSREKERHDDFTQAMIEVQRLHNTIMMSSATIKTSLQKLGPHDNFQVELVRFMITHDDFYADQKNAYDAFVPRR